MVDLAKNSAAVDQRRGSLHSRQDQKMLIPILTVVIGIQMVVANRKKIVSAGLIAPHNLLRRPVPVGVCRVGVKIAFVPHKGPSCLKRLDLVC